MSDSLLGRFLWYELSTTDMKPAEAFYKAVVGWTITPFGGAGMPYDIWTREGNVPVGGVMTLPDEVKAMGAPPHWMMYIGAPKLEETVAHVERLGGGTVSPVIEVPDVGRMRVLRDPLGAIFSIYEPSVEQPPEAAPEVGDVSWRELYTTDAPAALAFYRDLFGWRETEAMDMGPMGKYHMFGRDTVSMGGMMNKPPEMAQVPPNWGLYFRVPDVHAAADRVKQNGGQVLNGPMEVPGGDWIVNCLDPQGAAFSMHHRKS